MLVEPLRVFPDLPTTFFISVMTLQFRLSSFARSSVDRRSACSPPWTVMTGEGREDSNLMGWPTEILVHGWSDSRSEQYRVLPQYVFSFVRIVGIYHEALEPQFCFLNSPLSRSRVQHWILGHGCLTKTETCIQCRICSVTCIGKG